MSNLSQMWIGFFWTIISGLLCFLFFAYLVWSSHPQLKFFCLGWLGANLLQSSLKAYFGSFEQAMKDLQNEVKK